MPPAAPGTWIVTRRRIPEHVVPGKRLGRHVGHDSRNLAYPWRRADGRQLTDQLWTRHIPILDQGEVGSCTGNAETGSLGSDPDYAALPVAYGPGGHQALNEQLAVAIYSAAETIDGDGPYPPNDNGSTGPSAAKAAMNMGLISGYLHCLSLADVLDALEEHPVCIGSNWYDSMDSPDSSGLVAISSGAQVRGGHEYLCRGKSVEDKLVFLDNSWGTGWGKGGSFSYSWDTLERLLAEQGDGTVSLPLSAPAPTPVPVPTPTPAPPGPNPGPGPDDADLALYRQTRTWAGEHHVGSNHQVAQDLSRWYAAKGF
jgi:hypothetical protein